MTEGFRHRSFARCVKRSSALATHLLNYPARANTLTSRPSAAEAMRVAANMIDRRGFLTGFFSCAVCADAVRAATGPGSRSSLNSYYDVCSTGAQQSPIDLQGAIPAQIESPIIHWKPRAFELANDGRTIQVLRADSADRLAIGREVFELKHFHFHAPSEHSLDGKRTAMEVHFVHGQPSGRLAVVGAFLVPGASNSTLKQIVAEAPTKGVRAKLSAPVDPCKLVPSEGPVVRYEGSLTTPPCSEVVTWNIFKTPVQAAQSDIDAFRSLFPMNARSLQPTNRRFLLETRAP